MEETMLELGAKSSNNEIQEEESTKTQSSDVSISNTNKPTSLLQQKEQNQFIKKTDFYYSTS